MDRIGQEGIIKCQSRVCQPCTSTAPHDTHVHTAPQLNTVPQQHWSDMLMLSYHEVRHVGDQDVAGVLLLHFKEVWLGRVAHGLYDLFFLLRYTINAP